MCVFVCVFVCVCVYVCVYLHTMQASALWVESQPYITLGKFMAVQSVYFSQEEPHTVFIRQFPPHKFADRSLCSFLIGWSPLSHNFTPLNSLLVYSSLMFLILTIFVTVLMMSLSAGLRIILRLTWQEVEHFSNCLGAIYVTCQAFVLTGTNFLI